MQPTPKSEPLEELLENMYGRTTAIEGDFCALCKKEVLEFRDALSEKEYRISGMCQHCQDEIFG